MMHPYIIHLFNVLKKGQQTRVSSERETTLSFIFLCHRRRLLHIKFIVPFSCSIILSDKTLKRCCFSLPKSF